VGLVAAAVAAATVVVVVVTADGVAAGLHGHAAGPGVAALHGRAAHRCLASLWAAVAAHGVAAVVVISTAASTASVGHVVGSGVGEAGRNRESLSVTGSRTFGNTELIQSSVCAKFGDSRS